MVKKVIIFGGGISGLTVSHELCELGYDVTIIERNAHIGGLARTYQDKNTCPIEYSWRAYGPYYKNIHNIMKRIPFFNKCVYDNLIPYTGKITCEKKIPNLDIDITYSEYIKLLPIFFKYILSCDQRNIDNFSNKLLSEYLETINASDNLKHLLLDSLGPFLGMEQTKVSLYDVMHAMEMIYFNTDKNEKYTMTKYPTSYAWFEPWEEYLINCGVTIIKNTELIDIHVEENVIVYCTLYDKKLYNTTADYYISCLPPESLYKIMNKNSLLNQTKLFNDVENVYKNGTQLQLSVYYYLNTEVYLHTKNSFAYLPHTPWNLMVIPNGHIWGLNYLRKYCNSEINEILSVGICNPYKNGILIKKPWSKCTREEIKIETWYQLTHDIQFINAVCIKKDVKIIDFKMWDSYQFDPIKQELTTYEPKWANNINTKKYRPGATCFINNLFLGGGWTDTSTGLHSMESACESGKIAAKCVIESDKNTSSNVYLHTKKINLITKPIRFIDNMIYNNFNCFLLLLIIIIFCIISIYYKKNTNFSTRPFIVKP